MTRALASSLDIVGCMPGNTRNERPRDGASDAVPTSPKAVVLGDRLRALRVARKVSLTDLAARLGRDKSDLSRWENAKRVIPKDAVPRYLGALGVVGDEYTQVMDLVDGPDESPLLATQLPGTRSALDALLTFEQRSLWVTQADASLIPGPLQIAGYIRAIMDRVPPTEQSTRIAARLGRHEIFTRAENPVRLTAYIGEAALSNRIGDRKVMAAQMKHLLTVMTLPNVTIRVVPKNAGFNPILGAAFAMYGVPDMPPIVYSELRGTGVFFYDLPEPGKDTGQYSLDVDSIRAVAADDQGSRKYIEDELHRWEQVE